MVMTLCKRKLQVSDLNIIICLYFNHPNHVMVIIGQMKEELYVCISMCRNTKLVVTEFLKNSFSVCVLKAFHQRHSKIKIKFYPIQLEVLLFLNYSYNRMQLTCLKIVPRNVYTICIYLNFYYFRPK